MKAITAQALALDSQHTDLRRVRCYPSISGSQPFGFQVYCVFVMKTFHIPPRIQKYIEHAVTESSMPERLLNTTVTGWKHCKIKSALLPFAPCVQQIDSKRQQEKHHGGKQNRTERNVQRGPSCKYRLLYRTVSRGYFYPAVCRVHKTRQNTKTSQNVQQY